MADPLGPSFIRLGPLSASGPLQGRQPLSQGGSQPVAPGGPWEMSAPLRRAGTLGGTGFLAGGRPTGPHWYLPENERPSPVSQPYPVSWDHLPGKLLAPAASLSPNPLLDKATLSQHPTAGSPPFDGVPARGHSAVCPKQGGTLATSRNTHGTSNPALNICQVTGIHSLGPGSSFVGFILPAQGWNRIKDFGVP